MHHRLGGGLEHREQPETSAVDHGIEPPEVLNPGGHRGHRSLLVPNIEGVDEQLPGRLTGPLSGITQRGNNIPAFGQKPGHGTASESGRATGNENRGGHLCS